MAHTCCILVAEDEETDILLLQKAFERAGIAADLVVARDGQEAIDYLQSVDQVATTLSSKVPDLLLLDIKMPRLDGFHVLNWLRDQPQLKHIPAVVFSSSAQDDDLTAARELGARAYIVKPHTPAALTKVVQDLYDRYLRG